jgi:hypothetical protein
MKRSHPETPVGQDGHRAEAEPKDTKPKEDTKPKDMQRIAPRTDNTKPKDMQRIAPRTDTEPKHRAEGHVAHRSQDRQSRRTCSASLPAEPKDMQRIAARTEPKDMQRIAPWDSAERYAARRGKWKAGAAWAAS